MNPSFLLFLLMMFALLWFFMLRPQRRRQQEHTAMLESLRVGDEVLTAGGLYGTVARLEGERLVVEIAPETSVRIDRRAIARVIRPDELAEDELAELEEAPEDEPAAAERR